MPTPSLFIPPVRLNEIFGLNRWVRGVVDRLSAAGIPALAMPIKASAQEGWRLLLEAAQS